MFSSEITCIACLHTFQDFCFSAQCLCVFSAMMNVVVVVVVHLCECFSLLHTVQHRINKLLALAAATPAH